MKLFSEYILEAEEKVKATKEWMERNYNKFNKDLFNNELPRIGDVRLEAKKFRKNDAYALGMQGFGRTFFISREWMENGMYRMRVVIPGKPMSFRIKRSGMEPILTNENTRDVTSCIELQPWIWMNESYVQTKLGLEDTLIHEMIHLWVSKDGLEPKQVHGKEFTKKCNETRKLAEKLYGVKYQLTTRANNRSEFDYSDERKEELNNIIQTNKKRGDGILGVYLVLNENAKEQRTPWTKRFFFCTKRMLPKILEEVKYYEKKYLVHIYISENSYEDMCKRYGVFRRINKYKFWNGDYYKEAEKYMTTDATDIIKDVLNESLDEAKKPYIKPEIFMYEIPANTNLSEISLEDIINSQIEDENEPETKGSEENDKNMATPSK